MPRKLRIPTGRYSRHILICADQTKPKCAPRGVTIPAWTALKKRLNEMGLAQGDGCVFRSKVNCLRVCKKGPIAVVYPDGTWYHSAKGKVLERILVEHLQGGSPVEEYVFATNPLALPVEGGSEEAAGLPERTEHGAGVQDVGTPDSLR